MKGKTTVFLYIILLLSLTNLGCIEYRNHLSSDYVPIKTHSLAVINDSNVIVFHTCEKENANPLYEKYTIRGNITNIGIGTIDACTLNASFFNKEKNFPPISDNEIKSIIILDIKPNQTANFSIEKKYTITSNIVYYKINVAY